MPRLVWDVAGEHRYETGIDRGVLYLPDGSGVPWNGLTSIQENSSAEITPYYFDGNKVMEARGTSEFAGTLTAITYPDEFMQFDGFSDVRAGVFIADQPIRNTFSLSYRTRIGNDIKGVDLGYKIHILYNLTAAPTQRQYATLSSSTEPTEFSWAITGTPEFVPGYKPAVHFIIDSRLIDPYLLKDIEALLYGRDTVSSTPDVEPEIIDGGTPAGALAGDYDGGTYAGAGTDVIEGGSPFSQYVPGDDPGMDLSPKAKLISMADLVELIQQWVLMDVIDNGDGTFTVTAPDEFITMLDTETFQISGANATFLTPDKYELSTAHGF